MLELIMNLRPCFTDEDKEKCIPLLRRMLEISDFSQRKGLLALKDMLQEEENAFLKLVMESIIGGLNPKGLSDFMQQLILAKEYAGYELLSRLVIAQGCLYILEGLSSRHMALQLGAMLGEQYCLRAEAVWASINLAAKERIIETAKPKTVQPKCCVLEFLLAHMSDTTVQRVLKEVDNAELAIILSSGRSELTEMIFNNISKRLREILVEDIEVIDVISEIHNKDIRNTAGKMAG